MRSASHRPPKVYKRFGPRSNTIEIYFAHPSPKFLQGEKVQNLPRFSTAIVFEFDCPHFKKRETDLKSKTKLWNAYVLLILRFIGRSTRL